MTMYQVQKAIYVGTNTDWNYEISQSKGKLKFNMKFEVFRR